MTHAMSCARFSVCLSAHGTAQISSQALLCLGEMMVRSSSDDGRMHEEKSNREEKIERISMVFAELESARPRWLNIPLAYRHSCACSTSLREIAQRAIRDNPSSAEAWIKLQEWS